MVRKDQASQSIQTPNKCQRSVWFKAVTADWFEENLWQGEAGLLNFTALQQNTGDSGARQVKPIDPETICSSATQIRG